MAVSWLNEHLVLLLYVQPKASQDKFVALHNGELKLAITAPPIDGKANQHIIKWLAKSLAVAKSQISIEKGELSRHKRVVIAPPASIPATVLETFNALGINISKEPI